MASFDITSPDGQKFRISAPDDATQEQVMAYAQKNFKLAAAPAAPTRSWADVPWDALKNTPSSAGNLISGIANALWHPYDTVSTAVDMAAGGLHNVLPKPVSGFLDSFNSPSQQQDIEKAVKTADAVGQLYKNRYGSMEGFKNTLATDPVGLATDATAVLQGGAGLVRLAGKVPALASSAGLLGNTLEAALVYTNPLTPVLKGLKAASSAVTPLVKTNPGNLLASAIGATPEEARLIAQAAMAAPTSIVKGSDLTLSQALAHQGAKNPNVSLLERTAAGGTGGDLLRQRYIDQGMARLEALRSQGAEMYGGARAELADTTGNKIGGLLRTQAADAKDAARVAWQGHDGLGGVYGQAAKDGVQLMMPLEDMQAAMNPLGRGTVGEGAKARSFLAEAQNIGTMELPAMAPLAQSPASKAQTLEQAVRSAGGMSGGSGELRDLGIRQSGTTGLINNKTGQSADILAEQMHRRGFIPDADPATLMDALRNGGGRKLFATDAVESNQLQRMAEAAMGDLPEAVRVPIPTPFADFQRLRRSAGTMSENLADKSPTEAGVMNKMQGLLSDTADAAAGPNGGLLGSNMTPEFLRQYKAARDLTSTNFDLYKSGNNISQITRKPYGQNYTLSGDEITNKLWHGGSGLVGDVRNLQTTLNANNHAPALDALQRYVMTDAASKVTASGNLGSALPKYVENRLPGLQELMQPDQLNALTRVAKDIRNAEAAADMGIRGSDTQAKISKALDAGLLDSTIAKKLAGYATLKGIGGETIRSGLAKMVMDNKGKVISELLANPKAAAAALQDADFVRHVDPVTLKRLAATAKLAPIVSVVESQSKY